MWVEHIACVGHSYFPSTPAGPGLAIRVICQSEAFIQQDFAHTNEILSLLISFQQSYHAAAPGIKDLMQLLSAPEQETLFRISDNQHFHATLLPIRTVGVQVWPLVIM